MTGCARDEIVDDSEPEREEWRRERKKVSPRATHKLATTREVIELTDDESEGGYLQPSNIIDISDCTSDSSSCEILSSALSITTNHSHSLKLNGTLRAVIPSASPEAEGSQVAVSPNDSDTDGKADLGRFAFINSGPSMKNPSSRPGPSPKRSSTVIESSANAPPKRKTAVKHQFSVDFSHVELAKLTKCVSCNAQWTTRKTAAQKIKHVQSCAKKHSFNDETIRFLIRKEIDSVVEYVGKASDKTRKRKASVPPAHSPVPRTFYEHVVTDAAPRKKGRRAEASESVRSVITTRNAILDRARVVLDSVSEYPTEVGISSPVQMPSIGIDSFGHGNHPTSSTQPFGQSALSKKHRTDTRYILAGSSRSPSSSEEGSVLPATQAFVPSKFSSATRRPHELFKPRGDALPSDRGSQTPSPLDDILDNPMNESPPTLPDFCPNAPSARDSSLSLVLRRHDLTNKQLPDRIVLDGLIQTFRKRCNISDISDLEDLYEQSSEREMDDDNAYLHFDPGADDQQQLYAPSGSYALPKATDLPYPPSNFSIHSPKPKPQATRIADTHVKDSLRINEPNAKRKGKGKRLIKPEDEYDGLWEARMKDVIVRDTNLHLRILRYEPIHFDVFLKLATDEFSCSTSGKLKTHLRRYLDKEAISYYGTEPNGRRR